MKIKIKIIQIVLYMVITTMTNTWFSSLEEEKETCIKSCKELLGFDSPEAETEMCIKMYTEVVPNWMPTHPYDIIDHCKRRKDFFPKNTNFPINHDDIISFSIDKKKYFPYLYPYNTIADHVLKNLKNQLNRLDNREEKISLLRLYHGLTHQILYYQMMFPNFFFFFKKKKQFYFIGMIFCSISFIFFKFSVLGIIFIYKFGIPKLFEHEKRAWSYIWIKTMLFLSIINGGLLGYSYGTIGKYNFFLNMILYPTVTYILPIIFSIFFFVFTGPNLALDKNCEYNNTHYIITIILNIATLMLLGKKIFDTKYLLKYKKEIKIIIPLVEECLSIYSMPNEFLPTNFTYVTVMDFLYSFSFFIAGVGIIKLIYVILKIHRSYKNNLKIYKDKEII